MTDSKYPECDKLAAVREKSQMIGNFLDWLGSEKKIVLASYHDVDWTDEDGIEIDQVLFTTNTTPEKLLAEFFHIDLRKVEQERQQMLKSIRGESAARIATERA